MERRSLCIACVVALLATPAAGAAKSGEDRAPAELKVTAVRGVPELERLRVEREILRRISESKCRVRRPAPGEMPTWRVEVEILEWRELELPGGEPVFDPRQGRYLPGRRREVEARYTVRVRHPDDPVDPEEKLEVELARVAAETKPNASWEPREQASRMAREEIADDVRRAVCRATRD